jgi:hypothetical protein
MKTDTDQPSGLESTKDERYNLQREQRETYQPSQRTRERELDAEPGRTYERMPPERQNSVRDRYETPSLERAPSNRDTQRKSYATPQHRERSEQPVQRQDGGSLNRAPARTLTPSQRSTHMKKSESNTTRQPSRGSRSDQFRKRGDQ